MHGKGEFAKIKIICNIPIEAANIHNIRQDLHIQTLIVVKLKRDLKYRDYAYFEHVRHS